MEPIKRKIAKSAVERIGDLEQVIANIVDGVNRGFTQIDTTVNGHTNLLEALIEAVGGAETVQKILDRRHLEKETEKVAHAKAWVAAQVEAGTLAKAEVIGEQSLVIGTEFDAEQKPIGPGYLQVQVPTLSDDLKTQLVGKAIGTRAATSTGTFLEVTDIYNEVAKAS
ncbi:hypothetical protein UFOVP75_116 [uncultured Caudovirales phage]|uniref:Uncharacterized protein n=1 Tax=uncultured Caudovirales phage TaxID=2100421 RepID=A0A6J5L201_9CAUD|nr:hypothetical protein UFOVP75_116 [uncultured Caudovirales phage]